MSVQDWQENTLPKIFPNVFRGNIGSILDVGCFVSNKTQYVDADVRVAVDHYLPYLEKSNETATSPILYIKYDVRKLLDIFLPKSFEIICCLDVIEHLTLEDGYDLIKSLESLSVGAVVLETPNSAIEQNIDITGMGNHEGQTHRSAWNIEMLELLGYTCSLRDYKMQDVVRHSSGEKCDPNIQIISAYKLL